MFIKICLRDQYEYCTYEPDPLREDLVHNTYGHSYYITADRFLPDPLPVWAVAAIIAEVGSPKRFPRFTFGHKCFNFFRALRDPTYTDIRTRAAKELHSISIGYKNRRENNNETVPEFIEFCKELRKIRPDRPFTTSTFTDHWDSIVLPW